MLFFVVDAIVICGIIGAVTKPGLVRSNRRYTWSESDSPSQAQDQNRLWGERVPNKRYPPIA